MTSVDMSSSRTSGQLSNGHLVRTKQVQIWLIVVFGSLSIILSTVTVVASALRRIPSEERLSEEPFPEEALSLSILIIFIVVSISVTTIIITGYVLWVLGIQPLLRSTPRRTNSRQCERSVSSSWAFAIGNLRLPSSTERAHSQHLHSKYLISGSGAQRQEDQANKIVPSSQDLLQVLLSDRNVKCLLTTILNDEDVRHLLPKSI